MGATPGGFTKKNMKTNETTIALLNETWLYKGDKQVRKELEEIKLESGYCIIRKDRNTRGGGVAIVYDSKLCDMNKVQLKSMKGNSGLEIMAGIGKMKGCARSIAAVSCYLPPNYKRKENLKFVEVLSDVISEVQKKSKGAWITVGGDFNK